MSIIGTALMLIHYKKVTDSCALLDLAASIYIFHEKKRFNYFKRASKRQILLNNRNIMPIEGWGKISLPVKIKNQILILVFKNIAYI